MMAFAQVLVSGIAVGCVYGLVALSFVLIYKATETVSFMQGELLMVGAFTALALDAGAGWPAVWAVPAAIGAMVLVGAVLERGVLRRAIGQPHLTALLLTFGLGMILRGAVTAVPAASQSIHRLSLPFGDQPLVWGSLVIAVEHVIVIVATVLLAGLLTVFFQRSRTGLALRACSENPRAAALMGISVAGMHTVAWALGAGLAACAGLLLAPVTFVHVNMGLIALKAFPAAVLGGMTSLPGALLAGVFLGAAEAVAGLVLPEGVKDVVPYVLLIAVLLLFPNGFGGGLRRRRP
ncbi:MAG TPA: branched-chain amino acid ABC transporter permease [Rhodocyclaceae bacterium]|nr:branched-chain amino acid ABC transporter permease [Rhodocyclaceae bacterium]